MVHLVIDTRWAINCMLHIRKMFMIKACPALIIIFLHKIYSHPLPVKNVVLVLKGDRKLKRKHMLES